VTIAPSSAARSGGYLKEDGDNDGDEGSPGRKYVQDDKRVLATYGGRARPATARAIAALVRRYYAASLAADGASACALLDASLAKALAAQSGAPRSPAACAAALSPLLAQEHQHVLSEDPATMTVIGVYANGVIGLALVGFRNAPESDLLLAREAHAWKIDSLFDDLVR
jgi:hypothetical protein